ncbi:uncharacterized protein LOC123879884 [Maniola jurtina]|uniref:uncharacterized protein LOC123879884 n=1 Tax=Maniola jurtina TaxID=191418 RepID=UPI001E689765|nr:uncharacterized protein LOC123879884 [Maniola jurtina]
MDVDDEDDYDTKTLDRDDHEHFASDDDAEHLDSPKTNSPRFMVDRPPRPMPEKAKIRTRNYPEYDNYYYDIRRVNDMKNKLPVLLRKTQASTVEPPRTRPVQDFTHHRADLPEAPTRSTATTETTIFIKPTDVAPVTNSPSVWNSTELSLAEKSRLSTLKKSQRKDEVKNVSLTSKPPALLQVTRWLQTLVMAEPAQHVRSRAREVLDDSPERLARAKKLMRQKLFAGTRSVHDITDNWDEMVCDYIDISLLDGSTLIYPNIELLCLSLIIYISLSSI